MDWRRSVSSGAMPRHLCRKDLLGCTSSDARRGDSRFRFWICCSCGAIYAMDESGADPYSERRGQTVCQSQLHFTISTLRISQPPDIPGSAIARSEEHTSELQS